MKKSSKESQIKAAAKGAKLKIKVAAKDSLFCPSKEGFVHAYFEDVSQSVQLPYRNICHINLGFGIDLPKELNLMFRANIDLTSKGIIVLDTYKDENGDYRVVLGNVGKEIVVIKHGDKIGEVAVDFRAEVDWSEQKK